MTGLLVAALAVAVCTCLWLFHEWRAVVVEADRLRRSQTALTAANEWLVREHGRVSVELIVQKQRNLDQYLAGYEAAKQEAM